MILGSGSVPALGACEIFVEIIFHAYLWYSVLTLYSVTTLCTLNRTVVKIKRQTESKQNKPYQHFETYNVYDDIVILLSNENI